MRPSNPRRIRGSTAVSHWLTGRRRDFTRGSPERAAPVEEAGAREEGEGGRADPPPGPEHPCSAKRSLEQGDAPRLSSAQASCEGRQEDWRCGPATCAPVLCPLRVTAGVHCPLPSTKADAASPLSDGPLIGGLLHWLAFPAPRLPQSACPGLVEEGSWRGDFARSPSLARLRPPLLESPNIRI